VTAFEFARHLQDPDFRRRAMRAGYIQGAVTDVAAVVKAMDDNPPATSKE
jgi:hypothetical protein